MPSEQLFADAGSGAGRVGSADAGRVLVADGAMGTMLQAFDLGLDDFEGLEGCNEVLNVTRPDVVRAVHDAYFEVGCDAVETNTFSGSRNVLDEYGIGDRCLELNKLNALRAIDIRKLRNGTFVRVAGWVIVRQRPGTAKGFMFLSLEDETGVSNIIVTPQLFDKYRRELVGHPFLLIEGALQNQDNVISVKASHIQPLSFTVAAAPSHDFH